MGFWFVILNRCSYIAIEACSALRSTANNIQCPPKVLEQKKIFSHNFKPASVLAENWLYCMGLFELCGYINFVNFTICSRTFGGHCIDGFNSFMTIILTHNIDLDIRFLKEPSDLGLFNLLQSSSF